MRNWDELPHSLRPRGKKGKKSHNHRSRRQRRKQAEARRGQLAMRSPTFVESRHDHMNA